jgi:dihydroxyacetone kinase
MALGLGIHGEPGLSESDIPTSKELALELVTHLLEETPDSCRNDSKIRLCVLVNGLGGVKYEELYVLYNNISAILKEKNIEIVEPEVGELVTSFEMAGASLTFTWLNEEQEGFWKKPTYTPGYKKGTVSLGSGSSQSNSLQDEKKEISKGSSESQECAKNVLKILQLMETNTAQRADEYGLLDSYAGDGDHGIGMARGAHAAASAAKQYVDAGAGAGSTLEAAADSWSDKAGGTSGIIWGIILREIGKEFGDSVKPSAQVVASAVARASAEVTKFGKAQIGDKTLVDVLIPFSQKLVSENGKSLPEAWRSASGVASSSAADTANLLPKIGRARPHAEKSLGHQDPGATSLAMIISTIANFLEGK